MQIYRLKSEMNSKDLCKELDQIDAIAISTSFVQSLEEIKLAHHLAESAFSRKKNIGRKLKYEFLLWLAGKRDIKSAMEITTPKEGEDFFVVVFSHLHENILKRLKARKKKNSLVKDGEAIALERISLSRIRN